MSIKEINVPSFETSDGEKHEHLNAAIVHEAEIESIDDINKYTESLDYSDSFKKSVKEQIIIWTKYRALDNYPAAEVKLNDQGTNVTSIKDAT